METKNQTLLEKPTYFMEGIISKTTIELNVFLPKNDEPYQFSRLFNISKKTATTTINAICLFMKKQIEDGKELENADTEYSVKSETNNLIQYDGSNGQTFDAEAPETFAVVIHASQFEMKDMKDAFDKLEEYILDLDSENPFKKIDIHPIAPRKLGVSLIKKT